MRLAYVKWQIVIMKDFSLYPLLLPQLVSDTLENVPFCSGERDLQGHTLLAAATPSPWQQYLASSHPLPSLLLIQTVCFAASKGLSSLPIFSFLYTIAISLRQLEDCVHW
jgi:hypothetical protein